MTAANPEPGRKPPLTLAASLAVLGIVYGDIGTSPLYAFKASLQTFTGLPIADTEILGVLSLLFWSVVLIVTIKYVMLVMRADMCPAISQSSNTASTEDTILSPAATPLLGQRTHHPHALSAPQIG